MLALLAKQQFSFRHRGQTGTVSPYPRRAITIGQATIYGWQTHYALNNPVGGIRLAESGRHAVARVSGNTLRQFHTGRGGFSVRRRADISSSAITSNSGTKRQSALAMDRTVLTNAVTKLRAAFDHLKHRHLQRRLECIGVSASCTSPHTGANVRHIVRSVVHGTIGGRQVGIGGQDHRSTDGRVTAGIERRLLTAEAARSAGLSAY